MSKKEKSGSFMEKTASFIVDKRNLFFLLYIFILIFSLIAMGWVQVENDVTVYLAEESETRQGIEAMNENFVAAATARVMVSNVTPQTAQELADQLATIDGISMVTFDKTDAHYRNTSALFDLMFTEDAMSNSAQNAVAEIRATLAGYDMCIDTTVGQDMNAMLAEEMMVILIVAVVIILAVLTLTSRSYAEVPVLLITFGVAALMNMGTHFICGKISFISNSVAVVLQLALAIDYAIILCHRYTDERETHTARDACAIALGKAIPEISASSLTTISGLAALMFMDFGIGKDMSIVLIKSILLSLLSVFTLMPGLLVLFDPLMKKTKHKKLLPDITFIGKFAVKTRRVVPFLFVIIMIAGAVLSNYCPYCYSFSDLKTAKMSEQQVAYFKIKDTFGTSNMMALVIPAGDYEAEAAVLKELESRPEVKGAMGLANTEAIDGYKLTDALTPRQLSELMGLDIEVVQLLYSYYAVTNNQYGQFLNLDEYAVPLFDMFIFIKDELENRNIDLGAPELTAMMEGLETAQKQLQSEKYSRMVVYLNLPEESDKTFAFLAETRRILGKYYDSDYYVVGNSTNSRDLSASFVGDNLLISTLSVFFVILVLLFTFRSAGLPVLLIAVIQGSIWINFSIPTITGQPLYFLGYLIVNAIQMGANIDYAIVISSHYQEHKATMPHKQAIVLALNKAFPTIFTSGTMLASAGLLIGNLSAQPVVSIMGNCIGRGTIISLILVLFVLPAILVLCDSIIERTRFKIKTPELLPTRTATGTMRVKGHVRGHVSGYFDADIDGVLHGQLNASVSTDGTVEVTEENQEGGENNA